MKCGGRARLYRVESIARVPGMGASERAPCRRECLYRYIYRLMITKSI